LRSRASASQFKTGAIQLEITESVGGPSWELSTADVGDSVLYRNLSDIAHHVPQEDFWIIQVPFLALAEKAFALCQKAVMKQEWERTVLSSWQALLICD
jgi:hypothetical protein